MTFKDDYSSEQKPKVLKKRRKTKIDIQLQSKRKKNETEQEVKLFHKCMFCEFTSKSLQRFKIHIKRHQNVLPIGGFQLEFLSISRVINQMICYKLKFSHWWKIYLKQIFIYKICSPV